VDGFKHYYAWGVVPDAVKAQIIRCELVGEHPFPSNHFRFGFAEDFLEHLDQAESLIFLSEACRCLQSTGVLRLSFPGLSGVLSRHYRSSDFQGSHTGIVEAFQTWRL